MHRHGWTLSSISVSGSGTKRVCQTRAKPIERFVEPVARVHDSPLEVSDSRHRGSINSCNPETFVVSQESGITLLMQIVSRRVPAVSPDIFFVSWQNHWLEAYAT